MIQVRCAGCQASFDVDERRMPKSGMRVRCPKCGASFHVSPTGEVNAQPPSPAGAKPAAPPVVPRPSALQFGEIDLPAVPGVVDLPAPAAAAPPASPASSARRDELDFSDLPAVAPAKAPAPPRPGAPVVAPATPSAFDLDLDLDLPAPARPAAPGVDLPAVAPPRRPVAPASPSAPVAPPAKPPAGVDPLADLPRPLPPRKTPPQPARGEIELDLPQVAARPQAPPAAPTPTIVGLPRPAPPAPPAPPSVDLPRPAPPAAPAGKPTVSKFTDFGELGDFDDLPSAAAGLPVAKRAPGVGASIDFHSLDDLPSPAAAPPAALDLDAPLPSPKIAADLPAPADSGLPSAKKNALGRVALEKRAMPAAVVDPQLPVVAPDAALPSSARAPLPAPAARGDLPKSHPQGELPSRVDLAAPQSSPAGADADAFGEVDLPLGSAPSVPPGSFDFSLPPPKATPSGDAFDFSLPPPAAAPAHSALDEEPRRGGAPPSPGPGAGTTRGRAGGTAFGEINLGGDEPAPASVPLHAGGPAAAAHDDLGAGDEFDQIKLEKPQRDGVGLAAPSVALDVAPPPASQRADGAPQDAPPKAAPKAPSRRGLWIALGTVATVALAGAALTATPAGPFGSALIDEKIHGPARHAAARRAIDAASAALERDTFGPARRALRELDAQLERTPHENELAAFDAYAHYMVLARFGTDSALAGRARTLAEGLEHLPPGTAYLDAARQARELVTGHAERARRASATDPATRDLRTMALLDDAEPSEAVEAARAASERHPTARSRFLYARALYTADDPATARQEAEALLAASPDHAGARLLLARILSERGDGRERAIALAREVLGNVRDASTGERAEAAVLVGQTELARDRVAEARAAFGQALELDPRAPQALVGAGTILYRENNFTDALARFTAARTADEHDVDALVGVAMTSLALGRAADARETLAPAVTAHATDARVHFWLARALSAMNEPAAAEREYREALRLDNTNLDAYTTLAALLFSMQRPEAAEQVLDEARAHVADQGAIHRALGEQRAMRGDLAGAETELREAVAARPDDQRSRFLLAQTLRRLRRFDDAQRELEAVAHASPEYPGLLLERGALAEARGDAQSALATFRTALASDPQNAELAVRVAAALVATGRYAEADAQMADFVLTHPTLAEAQFVLGRARLAEGNSVDAVRLLERATELNATRADFRAYAAQANLERAQFARALEHADQAVALDPNYARGYAVRGEVRVRQGAVREALLDANRALALDPQLADADITLADADEALDHAREAIEMYRRGLAIEPNRGDWQARLGRVLADQGRNADAAAAFERAASLGDPLNPPPPWLLDAHRQLGDLLRERDPQNARRHYQRFLELSPANGPGVADARAALAELGGR